MHDLYALKDKLVDELAEYGRKDLSESSLKTVDTLAHAAKNIIKVIDCCEEDGYSHGVRGDYVRPDGSYRHDDMSYARGRGAGAKRDSMGRYSRAHDDMYMQLERLMNTATDEHTRSEIKKLMDTI